VNQLNPSVQNLFEVLASEIQSRLSKTRNGGVRVSAAEDSATQRRSDLIWWSWILSIDPACRVLAGASWATWKEICGLDAETAPIDFGVESLASLRPIIQVVAASKFGSEVTCGAAESSEEPPSEWTSTPFAIKPATVADMLVHFAISPDLEAALGGSKAAAKESEEQVLPPRLAVAGNSADILMHVEMPVTIILGSTTMRLKDLLNLTNGCLVELDQMLNEEVEVRVNNCAIAFGEVVSVDGNYAVRILRMAPPQNNGSAQELPQKAA
jgi:flagellar motor switch protein FliN